MKRSIRFVGFLIILLMVSEARAEWTDISWTLPEADIRTLAVHPRNDRLLYAASGKNLFLSQDGGERWKRVLAIRGEENGIRHVYLEGEDLSEVYVATYRGLRRSSDSGKSWNTVYRGTGEAADSVYWIFAPAWDSKVLWLGTAAGLVRITRDGKERTALSSLPASHIYSLGSPSGTDSIFAATDKGIYRSLDRGEHWERVLTDREEAAQIEGTELSQFAIEELSSGASFSNMAFLPQQNRSLAASSGGLFESEADGGSWKRFMGELPDKKINQVAASQDTFYVATDRGVFRKDAGSGPFEDISEGLPSKEVRTVLFHPGSGDLFAATKKGIFRYPKPGFKVTSLNTGSPDVQAILDRFRSEPTVREIQEAAIRYAEVHPEKIQAWRQAAMRKALLPTLSLSADTGEDQNVDIDRGGTGDPDKFIMGPVETNTDWHAGISWDLGDLIWNDDQTSIDTRSKLMVELRDDVLNEVTHLYFERRRLQVGLVMDPPTELPLGLDKELKLQELTAGIDALTDGFLTRKLNERIHA